MIKDVRAESLMKELEELEDEFNMRPNQKVSPKKIIHLIKQKVHRIWDEELTIYISEDD